MRFALAFEAARLDLGISDEFLIDISGISKTDIYIIEKPHIDFLIIGNRKDTILSIYNRIWRCGGDELIQKFIQRITLDMVKFLDDSV